MIRYPIILLHCYPTLFQRYLIILRGACQPVILLEGAGRYLLPGSSLRPID